MDYQEKIDRLYNLFKVLRDNQMCLWHDSNANVVVVERGKQAPINSITNRISPHLLSQLSPKVYRQEKAKSKYMLILNRIVTGFSDDVIMEITASYRAGKKNASRNPG